MKLLLDRECAVEAVARIFQHTHALLGELDGLQSDLHLVLFVPQPLVMLRAQVGHSVTELLGAHADIVYFLVAEKGACVNEIAFIIK